MRYQQLQAPGPIARVFLTLVGMALFGLLAFFGFFIFLGLLAVGTVVLIVFKVRQWLRPKQDSEYIDAEYVVVKDDDGTTVIEYQKRD